MTDTPMRQPGGPAAVMIRPLSAIPTGERFRLGYRQAAAAGRQLVRGPWLWSALLVWVGVLIFLGSAAYLSGVGVATWLWTPFLSLAGLLVVVFVLGDPVWNMLCPGRNVHLVVCRGAAIAAAIAKPDRQLDAGPIRGWDFASLWTSHPGDGLGGDVVRAAQQRLPGPAPVFCKAANRRLARWYLRQSGVRLLSRPPGLQPRLLLRAAATTEQLGGPTGERAAGPRNATPGGLS